MANNLEKLVGPEKLPTKWPWKLFSFSLGLLILVWVVYLGLAFGYRAFLNSEIRERDQAIEALAQSVPEAEQQALVNFFAQLTNLQRVLNNHTLASKIFAFIEQSANQNVFYTNLSLDVNTREIILSGATNSYETLAQQLEAFKQAPEVERFTINQADSREQAVNFRVVVKLKERVLK